MKMRAFIRLRGKTMKWVPILKGTRVTSEQRKFAKVRGYRLIAAKGYKSALIKEVARQHKPSVDKIIYTDRRRKSKQVSNLGFSFPRI